MKDRPRSIGQAPVAAMPPPPGMLRPIQPAPGNGARPAALSASSASSGSSWLSAKGLTKRLKAVTQACQTCRRNKAKCDGARPRCSGCVARGSNCGYEGEAGQSRQAALRTRLGALERLFSDLQSASAADTERILKRLRSGAADVGPHPPRGAEHDNLKGTRAPRAAPSSTSSDSAFSRRSSDSSSPSLLKSAVATSSVHASSGPEYDDALLPLPNAQTTWAAVEGFFRSCGKLFHVFSRQQMGACYRSVFIDGKADTSQKLAICCLCAVAAVGIQYNPGDFPSGMEKTFHDTSRRFFSEVMEERPLDTIKVCTMFSLYYIMNKATVALAYVEIGLSMARRQSQSTGICPPHKVSEDEWVDYRKAWRALIFFSSWLSSTLGYISGVQEQEFTKLLPIADQDFDNYTIELGELVQAEMTKIVLLKAGILRNHLAVQEITTFGMDGVIKELSDWHGQLPEPMRLHSLYGDACPPPIVRWSIYHVHLLYHGAFMLVHRRIAAHCVRLQRSGGDLTSASREPALRSLVEQGITSAQDTARIVSLLLSEQGVFKRCWIVIFQSHTACIVILHSIAQKQLHRFPPSSWAEDLARAQQCIDVLSFCGNVDPVALRFSVRLSEIYNTLAGGYSFDQGARGNMPELHPISYLFTTPRISPTCPPPPGRRALSFTLLFGLCRPWSDDSDTTNPSTTSPTSKSPRAPVTSKSPPAPASSNIGSTTRTTTTTTTISLRATTTTTTSNDSYDLYDINTNKASNNTNNTNNDNHTYNPSNPSKTTYVPSNPSKTTYVPEAEEEEDHDMLDLQSLDWDLAKTVPFRWDTDGLDMLGDREVRSGFLDSEAPSGWAAVEDLEDFEE